MSPASRAVLAMMKANSPMATRLTPTLKLERISMPLTYEARETLASLARVKVTTMTTARGSPDRTSAGSICMPMEIKNTAMNSSFIGSTLDLMTET